MIEVVIDGVVTKRPVPKHPPRTRIKATGYDGKILSVDITGKRKDIMSLNVGDEVRITGFGTMYINKQGKVYLQVNAKVITLITPASVNTRYPEE